MIDAYVLDWINLLMRWLHMIAGIAWIGSSFYFVWLDNHLTAPAKPEERAGGVHGELWSVHGGGFYHNRKYLTGPKGEPLTEDLHWFKWEAYTTWLSGMGMLALVYWIGASTYLIDPAVRPLGQWQAIGLSVATLVVGWLVYDALCRLLAGRETLLAAAVFGFTVLASWALFQVFSARGAFIHVGAMLGTIMVANVAMVIMPGQRRMVAQIRAGEQPDPAPGLRAKVRSTHNTYFTLPVLFVMISNHYPMTYSHSLGWLSLAAIMLAGVLVRQFFVLRHKGELRWALPALAIALLAGTAALLAPEPPAPPPAGASPVSFAEASGVIAQRCASCHAAAPTQAGFAQAPKGVMLDSPERLAQHAAKIGETVASRYMPPGNLTGLTDEERVRLLAWVAQGAPLR